MRVRLTKRYLDTLTVQKTVEIWDKDFPRGANFGVRVTEKGTKSFVFRYRSPEGTRPKIPLGRFPVVSLGEARTQAMKLAAKVSQGEDPNLARKKHQSAPTFAQLADDFLNSPRLSQRSPRTRSEYRRILKNDLLPAWGRMKAADIQKGHIVAVLDKVLERGSEIMASRVRALASVIFNFGVERDVLQVNLASAVRKPAPERARDRYLSEKEIKALWTALDGQGVVVGALYRFLLLTAQRSGETCLMQWTDIEDGVWTIPAENTKPGRSHTVPLSPQALEVLEPLQELGSRYVFPSPSPRAKGGPIRWLSKATERLKEECGFVFRAHDLRRTATTMLADLGTSEETLRKILNHKSGSTGVTAIYDRADRKEDVRQALFAWGAKLSEIVTSDDSPSGNQSARPHRRRGAQGEKKDATKSSRQAGHRKAAQPRS